MATYAEMLAFRSVLANFPETAKEAVSKLWNQIANDWDVDFQAEAKAIAEANGTTPDNVEAYYDWYATDRPSKVVVFYNDSKWLSDNPCFDSRCNAELLPRGSVVCAVIIEKGAVLHTPYLKETQTDQFKAELQSALIDVWELNYTADDLIENGVLIF